MDYYTGLLFSILDVVSFAVLMVCCTKIVTIMYKMATAKFLDVPTLEAIEELTGVIKGVEQRFKNWITEILEKQQLKYFEMFQNALKAHEKRMQQYIDEKIKPKDEEQ